jgi:hypothetical protein
MARSSLLRFIVVEVVTVLLLVFCCCCFSNGEVEAINDFAVFVVIFGFVSLLSFWGILGKHDQQTCLKYKKSLIIKRGKSIQEPKLPPYIGSFQSKI